MADGVELLAFMPLANRKDWAAWTPEGFYDATPGAQGMLRWHVNNGWDAPATDVPVTDIPGSYRPNVLPLVLQQLETPRALGLAVLAEHNEEVRRRTNSHVPPGTRLHLLSVGVGTYQQDDHLHLKFADHDAESLASAIKTTQEPLYTVEARSLLNQDANKTGIMDALESVGRHMEGGGNDLAVVFFSGHGAIVGANKLYLLPYDADVRGDARLRASAISVDELRDSLLELAKHGRVLVLLDACHSGATTMAGEVLTNNQDALKGALAAANITVLTSSSGSEFSREDEKWSHGAFTRALLDALGDPMADPSHIGLISSNGLAVYMHQHVPDLTDHQQTPGMEVRFESTVFALSH
jgi:Caspase domain